MIATAEAVTNAAGEIALKYYQPVRVLAQRVPSGKDGYVFTPKASISLAWVDPQDVADLLTRKAGCKCGGARKKQAFSYASEDDVRRWTNGGGR